MEDIEREIVEHLRTWLSNRRRPNDDIDHYHSNIVVQPPDRLRRLAFPELHLSRYTKSGCTPPKPPADQQQQLAKDTHLRQTLKSLDRFLAALRANQSALQAIECMRIEAAAAGASDRSGRALASLAKFNMDETVHLLQSALAHECAHEIQVNQLDCVLAEDSSPPLHEIVGQICVLLFANCPIRVVARSADYCTSLLAAYLVDMLHESGLTRDQLRLLAFDFKREATSAAECGFSWLLSPSRLRKSRLASKQQSMVGICFASSKTSLALRAILISFARESRQRQNLIILVEESDYDAFLFDWSNGFGATSAAAGADETAMMVPSLTDMDIKIDLNCIDIRSANRMSRPCINVIRFHSLDDLQKQMAKLNKISYIQLWCESHLMARQIAFKALQTNQCEEFWLNHLPARLAGHRFSWQLMKYYKSSMKLHMDGVYTDVVHDLLEADRLDALRKRQPKFASRKDRHRLVIAAYISLISKFKSMKQMNQSVSEAANRLGRFCLSSANFSSHHHEDGATIECALAPIGLAILVIRDERCVKSKSILIEFLFKNLILGNAVLLLYPRGLLGCRFPSEFASRFELPFELVELAPPHVLSPYRLAQDEPSMASPCAEFATPANDADTGTPLNDTWDSCNSQLDNIMPKKQLKCPKTAYAVEFYGTELTADKVELLVLALGTRRRSIIYSDADLQPAPPTTPEIED